MEPRLHPDDWAVGPGVRVGLPWPWYSVEGFDPPSGLVPILRVEAPRTDWLAWMELWGETEGRELDAALPSVLRELENLHRGPVIEVRKLRLHGSRAIVAAIDAEGGVRTWRIITEGGGQLIQGQMDVPVQTASGYQPHLDTMLGTWTWEG